MNFFIFLNFFLIYLIIGKLAIFQLTLSEIIKNKNKKLVDFKYDSYE